MSECLLATVHGVSSDAVQLKKLADEVADNLSYDAVIPVNYGEQRPLKAIDRQTRFLIFNNVALSLKAAREESRRKTGANPSIDVIAHSFGTLSVVQAIRDEAVEIRHLIMLGSIVDRWNNWDPLVRRNLVTCPPLNIVRPFDMVVRHAHFVNGDSSGARGFSPQGRCQAIDHFVTGGHNDYRADASVITQFLNGKLSAKDAMDEDGFKQTLSATSRARLRVLRAVRML